MKKYIPFICALIAAFLMSQTLYFKFTAQPESVELFTKLGLEPLGRIGIGTLELIASILILLPVTRFYGAFLGFGLMSGALFFHFTIIGIESNGDGGLLFIFALVVWLCCLYLCYEKAIQIMKTLFKKRTPLLIVGIASLSFFSSKGFAQGCSDAGFCSVGEMKSEAADSADNRKNKLAITPVFGIGEDRTFILTPTFQYDRQLSKSWSIQTKVTANFASGNLGSVFGFGDLIQSGSYAVQSNRKLKTSFTVGIKVPLSNANRTVNGRSLPMTYQSSLGTLDAIAGLSLKFHQFKAAFGIQIPISNLYGTDKSRSSNGFLKNEWDSLSVLAYPSTNGFTRAPDALFKLEYVWKVSDKFTFIPGLLNIYHFSQDSYYPIKGNNESKKIANSQGLTTNLTLVTVYQINKKLKASIVFGTPLIVREVRPDGLTRSFVLGPEISYNF